jgi:Na+/H+ antiporter NhaD/arsenite permease-like protein
LFDQPQPRETLNRVEWDILIFFPACLLVGGMNRPACCKRLSVLNRQGGYLAPVLLGCAAVDCGAVLGIVDNVPNHHRMVPIIHG